MALQGRAAGLVLAVCLLGVTAQSASAQTAAAAAGKAGAVASAGALPAASLAGTCKSSASVSPWDTGNHFPDVVICCGGSIDFQWSGVSSVWQISSAACPAAFRNTTTSRQLIAQSTGSGGVRSLYLPIPGTYYFTSATPGACSGGLVFKAQVPPGSGSVCPLKQPLPKRPTVTTTAPVAPSSEQASAIGPPGGTSTSTAPGAAAGASGPPGTARTATAPGMSFSSAGNFGRKLQDLLAGIGA